MREEGLRGAALALSQLDRINEYISAVQIGVTMTSIAIGALATPALADILKGALGSTPSHDVAIVDIRGPRLRADRRHQLIAGEMVPKLYAIDRAESIARRIARPLQAFSVLFPPGDHRAHGHLGSDPALAGRRDEHTSGREARQTSSSA